MRSYQVKVILHMAISLNGMIARENYATDFLSAENWKIFVSLAYQTGAMIWGRITHEDVRTYGEQYIRDLERIQRVVVSRDTLFSVEPGWQLAASPQHALDLLTATGVEKTLLVGGASLNSAFARAALIDEVILTI
jgi:dihydrofolate reductase